MIASLSQERLKEVLSYDKSSGLFKWRIRVSPSANAGDIAGHTNTKGYVVIRVDSVLYRAHRLAWFYMFGLWPKHQIDHKDHDRSNNKACNIRETTNYENHKNMSKRKTNKSGYTGVSFNGRRGKWEAYINSDSGRIHLGCHIKKADAISVRKKAEVDYKYYENHGI